MTRYLSVLACCCLTCASLLGEVGPKPADLKASRTKAVDFLKTSQADDGSWTSPEAPGISGLVAYSLLLSGVDVDDPEMQKALKHLETFKQPDGGIYQPKSNHANYETSICMLAFHAANKDGRYDDLLKAAEKYVRKLQWDESEDIDRTDPKYGGQGYGSTKDRPDLSNTMFFLEALQATGPSPTTRPCRRLSCFSHAAKTWKANTTPQRRRRKSTTADSITRRRSAANRRRERRRTAGCVPTAT